LQNRLYIGKHTQNYINIYIFFFPAYGGHSEYIVKSWMDRAKKNSKNRG